MIRKLIARTILVLALVTAFTMVAGGPASATTGAPPTVVLAVDWVQVLNLLLAVVFPVLIGLVTTKVTSGAAKAILLATISLGSGLVSALLASMIAGTAFDLVGAALTGLAAWVIAIATHFGIWRPTGVTDRVQAIGVTPRA
jgi:hypothetical protein